MQWGIRAPRGWTLTRRVLGLSWLLVVLGVAACSARSGPGTGDGLAASHVAVAPQLAVTLPPGAAPVGFVPTEVQLGSIVPVVTETGFLRLSVDGVGTLGETGVVRIEKPAGATVRRAFLAAASTGMSGRQLVDGDVTVDGAPLSWLITTPSSINSWNHWAEVTSIVATKLDAAEPGLVEVTIGEADSSGIDGEILAVIFDDADRAAVSTVVLLFGAQQVQGDTFNVRLSEPIDLENPNFRLDLSLGIAFGYVEGQYRLQSSLVDVNGQRLTSSAGGQDDGSPTNGALLTVGGVGDSTGNPPPDEPTPDVPDNTRFDDELYDLRPFTQTGDTELTVFTVNPTNDDNIFFSALFASGPAVIGEGILLGPGSARVPAGTSHTVTATVQNEVGKVVVARDVTFTILAGPNAGETAVLSTDTAGEAELQYVGDAGPGVDEIQASFVDSRGVTQFSSVALAEWFAVERPPVAECTDTSKPVGDDCAVDVQPAEVGEGSTDPDGDSLSFALEPTGPFGLGATPVTLTVTDNSGLAASCGAVVTVIDTTPPALALPDTIVVGCAPPSGAPVTFEATATDNCSAASVSCSAAGQTVASGATFPVGTTSVTCDARDGEGNLSSGSFSVTVTDHPTGPVIQCNAPDVVSGEVTITATASDDCADIVSIEVTDYRCVSTGRPGRDGGSDRACPLSTDGATLIIGGGGCSSGSIEWTVRAVDATGNETTQGCRAPVDGDDRRHPGHGHGWQPRHRR
jgi:HYR domain